MRLSWREQVVCRRSRVFKTFLKLQSAQKSRLAHSISLLLLIPRVIYMSLKGFSPRSNERSALVLDTLLLMNGGKRVVGMRLKELVIVTDVFFHLAECPHSGVVDLG